MPLKSLLIFFLFYFFALAQNSFLMRISPILAGLNFVFIFFILFVFFKQNIGYFQIIFWAIIAGLFLDIFSPALFGLSIFLLILIGTSIKKVNQLFKISEDKYPFWQFLIIFLISYIVFNFLNLSWLLIINLAMNLILALIGFWIFKFFFKKNEF
jgi:cell shape-determining protein MreD